MQESTRWKMEGQWDQWRGRIKKTWGELTDDDLQKAEGDFDRLVGVIKERTGENLETIHTRLDEMAKRYRE